MKLTLCANVEGQYFSTTACIDIPELYTKCFEPLRTGDDSYISRLVGDVSSAEERIVMKTRKDAAEILSKELALMIVSVMKKQDTFNGDKINEN